MDILLRIDFINHYGLSNITPTITIQDYRTDFQLLDNRGGGSASYSISPNTEIRTIDYEAFIDSLPNGFRLGREKCDFIVFSNLNVNYFFLNELTNTQQQYTDDFINSAGALKIGKRNKAVSQMLSSLRDLMIVPTIRAYIEKYTNKRCIFFNKQVTQPPSNLLLNALTAFNRVNTIITDGFQMYNADIAAFNFELYEYSGNNICIL